MIDQGPIVATTCAKQLFTLGCECRAKLTLAETRALELEEQMTNLAAAKAAAEVSVLEHLALREKQTERIRKAKAGGVKGAVRA